MRSVAKDLYLDSADPLELQTVLDTFFGHGSWDGEGNSVAHAFEQDGEVVAYSDYDKDGVLVDVRAALGLTDSALEELVGRVETEILTDHGTYIARSVLFSSASVRGHWRYSDSWQILPAPDVAPRPPYVMGDHPFVLEMKVRRSPGFLVQAVRTQRRYWSLHLLLSLVLRAGVTRQRESAQHVWAFVHEPGSTSFETRWVQEGYSVPDFQVEAEDFTAGAGDPIPEIADSEYHELRRIASSEALDVPVCLSRVAAAFDEASPTLAERFLRACYWLNRGQKVWHISKSLSLLGPINAIEVLCPEGGDDPCPVCGANRAPGPTQMFHEFVEHYAGVEDKKLRTWLYRLRSQLVHGHRLFAYDTPGAWAGFVPHDMNELDAVRISREIARTAIINWMLEQAEAPTD